MPGVIHLTYMGIDPGVLHWTRVAGFACHAEPTPLFAMKLARALAIRALIGGIHLSRGKRGLVTPSKVLRSKALPQR
jgi:hypothetical protein